MCKICATVTETRNINLHIIGSEGLDICHTCEMMLVTHIRNLMSISTRVKVQVWKNNKKEEINSACQTH